MTTFSPNGAAEQSPGQRPGARSSPYLSLQALKGARQEASGSIGARPRVLFRPFRALQAEGPGSQTRAVWPGLR